MKMQGNPEKEKIVFGGINLPDNQLFNDVWIINYSNVTFNSALSEIPGTVCTPKKTKGEIPCARKGHCAATNGKNMYVYGGISDDEDTNWIHQLNLETWTWKKLSGIGKPMTGRSFFSYCTFEEDKLMIFGGIDNDTHKYSNDTYFLRLDDLHWSYPFIAGQVPSPRYNHAAVTYKGSGGNYELIIQGGLEQQYCTMEIYKLVEIEPKENTEWEKAQPMNVTDKIAIDVAGTTILDQKNYLSELDHIISRERTFSLELDGDIVKLEEEISRERHEHNHRMKQADDKIRNLDDEYQMNYDLTKNLFSMIPAEQLIAGELQKKGNILEGVIQQTESYLIALDKLFIAITKHKLDESDNAEKKIRILSDGYKEEINKARDLHKASLTHLKTTYDGFSDLISKTDNDIASQVRESLPQQINQRKSILEIDPSYEEILVLQNEQDENHRPN